MYIGGSAITLVGANAVARLGAGESLSVDLNDGTASLYAVAGTTGQKLYKMALT